MKKFRGIRRYYRSLDNRIAHQKFHFDQDGSSWYNHWHIHLDWEGITETSVKHRRSHFKKYIDLLKKVDEQSRNSNVDFQCWIFLDANSGSCDAIYLHTKNPHSEFPLRTTGIQWGVMPPALIQDVIDAAEYEVGCQKEGDFYQYYIYKREVGLPLK
ncbi:hypothetical protein B5M42_015620 [Paenibacillus athensensis]|uniref:Uncharacterized protein n=1 Tax=Paenibacillus athensensis TaxID=1967502 RepID=A0A4Y8Q7Y3_9BACL|nr:hypothetical protein [Paenibacillus athensensis]MCD1260240.1 hypothetical protein [Paenibacillus athensensis]